MRVSRSAEAELTATSDTRPVDRTALPLAGVILGAVVVAALADRDTIEDGPVLCPFRRLTGLPCPGCGLTRSWVYLVHGQWQDAFAANLFGPILLAFCLVYVALVGTALARRRPPPDLGKALRSKPFIALGVAWIGYAVIRLIDLAVS